MFVDGILEFITLPLLSVLIGIAGELLSKRVAILSGFIFLSWFIVAAFLLKEDYIQWSLTYTVLTILGGSIVKFIHSLRDKESLLANSSSRTKPYDKLATKDLALKRLRLISLIPFFLFLLLFVSLVFSGETVSWLMNIFSIVSLFISGYGITSYSKGWNIAALISIICFTSYHGVMGYYDYLRWFSTKIALFLLVYFIVIYILKNRHVKKELI